MKPHQYTNPDGQVLILKVIPQNRMCHNEFPFPEGIGTKVIPTSWSPEAICGGGIHGWPWGFGLGDGKDVNLDGMWLVLADKPENIVGEIERGLKCKCKEPVIIFEGSFKDAFALVSKEWPAIITKLAVEDSKLAASGDYNKLAASGHRSNLAASGYNSHLAASGKHSNLDASGYYSQLAASGYGSILAASGDESKLAASGDESKLAASGYRSNLAASGNDSNLATSGNCSRLAASGENSKLAASGNNSSCIINGNNGQAKVGENGFFVLTYWNGKRNIPVVGIVGRKGIKANTWYKLDDTGKIVSLCS